MKTVRTFRIDNNLLDALEQISNEHGDITKHIEAALSAYKPIKCIMKAKPKEALEIPPEINLAAWTEWEAYRRIDKHKTITKAAANKQFKLLKEYDPEQQQQIIDNSIQNDYQGLFPLKGGSNAAYQKPNQVRRSSAVDRVKGAGDQRERARQDREGDGPPMAEACRDLRASVSQPVRGNDTGELGIVIEGSYTRSN